MSDEQVPGQDPAEASAPQAPAVLTEDRILELIGKGVTAAFDARIPGLQSAYDKQIGAIKREVERSRLAPDEIEAEDRAQLEAERDQALRAAAVAQAALKFPDVFEDYQRMISAESAEEQLRIFAELKRASQAAPAADTSTETHEDVEQPTPPIDPNKPLNLTQPYSGPMNKELAQRILESASVWPKG